MGSIGGIVPGSPFPPGYHLLKNPAVFWGTFFPSIGGFEKAQKSNDAEYFADIAKAYRTELQILYEHGLRNVQNDDPNLACKAITVVVMDPLTDSR